MPTEPAVNPFSVLIYGGGTATGSLAIQFAKLSGLVVIATCSSYNIDLIKNLGADAVFNYNSITVGGSTALSPSCFQIPAQRCNEHYDLSIHGYRRGFGSVWEEIDGQSRPTSV